MRRPFEREEAAAAYKTAVDTPDADYGSRDARVAKAQSDRLSSFQQGFSLRHRSRLAMMADAASRTKAMGDDRITLTIERPIANMETAE